MENAGGGVRLRPMGVGDVVDETFRLWRRHFVTFVVATAVVLVPVTVLSLVSNLAMSAFQDTLASMQRQGRMASLEDAMQVLSISLSLMAITLPIGIFSGLAGLTQYGALVRLASDAVLGRPLAVGEAYRASLGRLLSILWASILVGLAVVLLAVTILGIPVAIYFGVSWTLYLAVIMIEGTSGRRSLSRSSLLVEGHRWRVLGILIVLTLITWVLVAVPSALVGVYAGMAALSGERLSPLLQVVTNDVSVIVGSIFGPLPLIANTLLFYELRVRKEAFDIEQRLEAADQAPAVSPPEA